MVPSDLSTAEMKLMNISMKNIISMNRSNTNQNVVVSSMKAVRYGTTVAMYIKSTTVIIFQITLGFDVGNNRNLEGLMVSSSSSFVCLVVPNR